MVENASWNEYKPKIILQNFLFKREVCICNDKRFVFSCLSGHDWKENDSVYLFNQTHNNTIIKFILNESM